MLPHRQHQGSSSNGERVVCSCQPTLLLSCLQGEGAKAELQNAVEAMRIKWAEHKQLGPQFIPASIKPQQLSSAGAGGRGGSCVAVVQKKKKRPAAALSIAPTPPAVPAPPPTIPCSNAAWTQQAQPIVHLSIGFPVRLTPPTRIVPPTAGVAPSQQAVPCRVVASAGAGGERAAGAGGVRVKIEGEHEAVAEARPAKAPTASPPASSKRSREEGQGLTREPRSPLLAQKAPATAPAPAPTFAAAPWLASAPTPASTPAPATVPPRRAPHARVPFGARSVAASASRGSAILDTDVPVMPHGVQQGADQGLDTAMDIPVVGLQGEGGRGQEGGHSKRDYAAGFAEGYAAAQVAAGLAVMGESITLEKHAQQVSGLSTCSCL